MKKNAHKKTAADKKAQGNDKAKQKVARGKCAKWLIAAGAVLLVALVVVLVWYFGLREAPESSATNDMPAVDSSQGNTSHNGTTIPPATDSNGNVVDPQQGQHTTDPSQATEPSGGQSEQPTVPSSDDKPVEPSTDSSQATTPGTQSSEPDGSSDGDGYYTFPQGISVSPVKKYAGMFMEDGTNDTVSDIMMVVVRNDTSADLQLARLEVVFEDAVAEFQITNLPAGKSVVVLEKSRMAYSDEPYQLMKINDVVFFQEPMSLCQNRVQITGGKGYLEVENVTDMDLGAMYVYFKNSASDGMLYGGITYRTKVEPGLKAGETLRVLSGHYDPDTTTILLVQIADV